MDDASDLHVLVSQPRGPTGTAALGAAHYSYGFAFRNFTRMLREAGARVTPLKHPERFKSLEYARSIGLDGPAHPHLMIRSTEELHPVAGAWNIGCFAWEFDVLSGPGLGHESVLGEQTTMLGLCDELWAPSGFTGRVLEAHGLRDVAFVPSPVFPPLFARTADRAAAWEAVGDALACPLVCFSSALADGDLSDDEADYHEIERRHARPLREQPALRDALARGGPVFVSVFNASDRRKNVANLIDGFLMGTQARPDAVLVIKLVGSGRVARPAGYLFHQIRHLLARPFAIEAPRILLVGDYLTDEAMCGLFNGSDFYVCTSLAEGQNAPLLEAIRHGCLPVSTANTAMADYVDAGTAVVIPERRFPGLVPLLAADVSRRRYAVDHADRFAVARAVGRALALGPAEAERIKAAAQATAGARFWVESVRPRAVARLREVSGRLAAQPPAGA